jgi:PKD repeat protein
MVGAVGCVNPLDNVTQFRPGSQIEAAVDATEPDGDDMQITWEIREDHTDNPQIGGYYEEPTVPINGSVISANGTRAVLRIPGSENKYRIHCYVRDGNGSGATVDYPFRALNSAPQLSGACPVQAVILNDVYSGLAPLTVQFRGNVSTGESLSYEWDFGNGETSTDADVNVTFDEVGLYSVTLGVSSGGESDEASVDIEVYDRLPFTLQAEEYDEMSGVDVDDINGFVSTIDDGDWLRFDDVEFGSGFSRLTARYAVDQEFSGQYVELRLDDVDGELIGTLETEGTGGWTTFKETGADLTGLNGTHTIYLVFRGGNGHSSDIGNYDRFSFTGPPTVNTRYAARTVAQARTWFSLDRASLHVYPPQLNAGCTVEIINPAGQRVMHIRRPAGTAFHVPIRALGAGAYIVRLTSGSRTHVDRVVLGR